MAVCARTRRRIYRCFHRLCMFNISFFVWLLFVLSLFSLMVAYISFVLYLDSEESARDRELDLDFPVVDGVDDVLFHQNEALARRVAEQAGVVNWISPHVMDSTSLELDGWWMPQVRWNPEIDCSLPDQPGTCGKVLSTKCKGSSVRGVFQFLPINPDKPISGIYFHAKSAASKLMKDTQKEEDTMYSAVALLRFTDHTSDKIRLDFPPGTHPYVAAEVDRTLPHNKVLQSVTVMLCCYGYRGTVKFMDVTLRPVLDAQSQVAVLNDYILKCPDYFRTDEGSAKPGFDVEQFLTADDVQTDEESQLVTLVTQLSLDRIDRLETSLKHWQGPVSVALYVPTKSSKPDRDHGWKRRYIEKKLGNSNLRGRCNMQVVFGKTAKDEYPVNYLRNLATRQVKTKYMLHLDADFAPSPDFQSNFKASLDMIDHHPQADMTAFVVPAFEYSPESIKEKEPDQPRTKQELMNKLSGETAVISPFKILMAPEGHRPTDYRAWYSASQPYRVKAYQDKYEPFLILKNIDDLPSYDERFSGYGMNKVTFVMELHALGYEFVVLPNTWAIHLPHRETSAMNSFFTDPLYRLRNRADRFEFVSDLMRRHNLRACSVAL